jgi:hypothetical protein
MFHVEQRRKPVHQLKNTRKMFHVEHRRNITQKNVGPFHVEPIC